MADQNNANWAPIVKIDDGEMFCIGAFNWKRQTIKTLMNCQDIRNTECPNEAEALYYAYSYANLPIPPGIIPPFEGSLPNPPRRLVYSITPFDENRNRILDFARENNTDYPNNGDLTQVTTHDRCREIAILSGMSTSTITAPLPDLHALQQQITTLTQQLDTARTNHQTIRDALATARQESADLQHRIDNDKAASREQQLQLQELRDEVKDMKEEKEDDKKDLKAVKKDIKKLKDDLESVNDEIEQLENETTSQRKRPRSNSAGSDSVARNLRSALEDGNKTP